MARLFDEWPDTYDQWFETPIGRLIKGYESDLICRMLKPESGETILDAGCGTGIFTADIMETGARMVGLELSLPMLDRALDRLGGRVFHPVQGDMVRLPFADRSFHKTVSVTAIEFIQDAKPAIDELFRVTRSGGVIVAATLNALSPWAHRRAKEAREGHALFSHAVFRTPEDLLRLSAVEGTVETAIHFDKEADPNTAREIESSGQKHRLDTGAFVAARWEKLK